MWNDYECFVNVKKCQNILASRAQTNGTIFMIFKDIAQNFDSVIDAKFQVPSFKDKGVIKVQSKSGAADRASWIALRARGNTGL